MSSFCALVQTVDFFTPIVDDPYAFGQIAAANALSDVYAMGGRPMTALNILGVPIDRVPADVIAKILRGGFDKTREAKCASVGGHTIRNPEPIYGMAVTGVVNPRRMLTNAGARAGDVLVLTKPLGTGIATTAIKRGLATPALARRAVRLMSVLNTVGAAIAEARLASAATDVTGYGLLGHLANICRGSHLSAQIDARAVPAISREIFRLIEQGCIPGGSCDNHRNADALADWDSTGDAVRALLTDAQTSGGLLLAVSPAKVTRLLDILKRHRTPARAIIGKLIRAGRSVQIVVR
jgi:selenide,water dikinase